MMKNYIIGFTASVLFGAPLLAQSSEPIVALDLPPETVPVVAVDAHNGGIQYTGKTRPLAEIVRALGNSGSTFDTTDPPTAVMQNPDGSWGAYNIPVDKLDRGFGGDGKVAPAPVNDPGAQGDVPLDRNSLDGIPVVAPDTRSGRGGVSLTGEYLSRETVAASRRPGSIEKYGDATALIRTASGRLVVYSQPLARLDMKYGGDGVVGLAPDGVHAFEGAEPIQLIGTGLEQLEQFPEWKGPIEVELARDSETSNPEAIDLFPDDMSGDWKMTIVDSSHEGCSPQIVAAGESAGRKFFKKTATTQSPDFVPSELIPDGNFHSGWSPSGTDTWSAVSAEVDSPQMATRSTYTMEKVSTELVVIKGTMQFNMAPELAAMAGAQPNCTFHLTIDATR